MADELPKQKFRQELFGYVSSIVGGHGHVRTERKLAVMSIASIVLLLLIGFFAYIFYLSSYTGIEKLVPYLLYTLLSAVALTAALAHHYAHKSSFTCMEGMMVGMTIGMIGGFLFGAIIGATNGMFAGSVFGMAVGMAFGAYAGKCCGIMGFMEGLMGGLMAGTMGAMLSVMMALDNLALFMPILMASCLAILGSFAYMIHTSAGKREEGKVMGFAVFFAICVGLVLLTTAVMLFVPRSTAVIL
ncbi:MAG: hypothetical protein NTV88_05295 [Candidatus Micrarchaeota archaeon]|nr:hypothetical protein [Candidatus Micrarchaeota archaeon]